MYLYKYRQDKDLLVNETRIVEIAAQIEKNLKEKLSPEDFAVVMKQHRNLFVDICNMAGQNKEKFGRVYDDMLAVTETWVDIARKERTFEIILNMIKKNYDDDLISDATEVSLEEITKIRKEHSNQ